MLNPRIAQLGIYPFWNLTRLLEEIPAPDGLKPLALHVGQPMLATPDIVARTITEHKERWRNYPPHPGLPDYRTACAEWLVRRFNLADGAVDPERHVLPVAGTKEGLFHMVLLCVPGDEDWRNGTRPAVLMPNPVYQVYFGAAVLAGAEPVPISATAETGFMPDYASLDRDLLARTAMMYLCNPGNPQGAIADLEYLKSLIRMAREYGFTLVVDECYSEIYRGAPPPGGLEACAALGEGFDNVLVLHSLSKRSSAPGLRCGFVAGDESLIDAYRTIRSYTAVAVPEPILHAGAALWRDETHVAVTRGHYQTLFGMAERILGNVSGFYNPPGGFFLWLQVDSDEDAAVRLWREAAVRTMPGSYMAQDDYVTGINPGDHYVRVALVHDPETAEEGLQRIANVLGG
jgi:aspartate/methionine/tyrosine aminotransferase